MMLRVDAPAAGRWSAADDSTFEVNPCLVSSGHEPH